MGFMEFLSIYMYLYQILFSSTAVSLVCFVFFECGGRIQSAGDLAFRVEAGGVFAGSDGEGTLSVYVP